MNLIPIFNYGSNYKKQLEERCKGNIITYKCKLLDYKMIFGDFSKQRSGGVATIKKCKGSICLGNLCYLTKKQLENLDNFEGTNNLNPGSLNSKINVYRRKLVNVILNGKSIKAFVYIKNNYKWICYPSEEYLNCCLKNMIENWKIKKINIYDNNYILRGIYNDKK